MKIDPVKNCNCYVKQGHDWVEIETHNQIEKILGKQACNSSFIIVGVDA